jgi:hypothetical protein
VWCDQPLQRGINKDQFHFSAFTPSQFLNEKTLAFTFDYLIIASAPAFNPHRLIRTPIEEVLYYKAHIANVYTRIADPKEHEIVALMLAILYSNVFPTRKNFAVSAEQPPTPDSDTRCDIVVRYLESGYQKIRALCFAKCKRAKKNQAFSLKALEEQALGYYRLYLDNEKMLFVYAAIIASAYVRLWGYYYDKAKL